MNNGENTNKKNYKKKLSLLLLILLLLALITEAVLASRLGKFNKKKDDGKADIPIGDDAQKPGDDAPLEAELLVKHDAEIFRVSYEEGNVTVVSSDGQKVIAPGTKWDYSFRLINTKSASLDYQVCITATVEGLDQSNKLPVQARLKSPKNWVVGGADKYVPLSSINKVMDTSVLAAGHSATYTFGWRWPFESGDDDFDTMLGNTSFTNPIVLKLNIWVYAWNDKIPDKPGGEPVPPTGDDFNIGIWMSLIIISMLVFIAVLARDRKKRGNARELIDKTSDDDEIKRE